MSDESQAADEAVSPAKKGRKSRYFAQPEQVAASLSDARKDRKARKARVRHDALVAPIDGDYEPLRLTNEDPDFKYFWASDADRARYAYRGWVEEKWGPNCAAPKYYFGDQRRGETIRFKELTLMKLPRALWDRINTSSPSRVRHASLMKEILSPSKANVSMSASVQEFSVGPTA